MVLKKVKLSPQVFELINSYKSKTIDEIKKIQVQWACGINKKYRRYPIKGTKLFYVELEKLIATVDFGEMGYQKLDPQRLFTGVEDRDFRIARALYHWDQNGYIDPPEIFPEHSQNITFADGRHRTIAAFHIGEKHIPVLVHRSVINKLLPHIELIKLKE